MSLNDAKQLVWLIADRDRLCDIYRRFPRMENSATNYYQSVVDLHEFIMGLVRDCEENI